MALGLGGSRNSKAWCFTINAYAWDKDPTGERLFSELPAGARFVVWQHEKGEEEGRDHIQGYIRMERASSMGQIKRALGYNSAHLQKRYGTEAEAANYCRKEDTRIAGPWEFGVQLVDDQAQGARTDLAAIAQQVVEGKYDPALEPVSYIRYHAGIQALEGVLDERNVPEMRQILLYVIWGVSGTGKTFLAYNLVRDQKEVYKLRFPSSLGHALFFLNYTGQGCLLLDEFTDEKLTIQDLNQMLDPYPMHVRVDTARQKWARWLAVVITTNQDPALWYKGLEPGVRESLQRRIHGRTYLCESRNDCIDHFIALTGIQDNPNFPPRTVPL